MMEWWFDAILINYDQDLQVYQLLLQNQQDTQQLHHSNIYISCESRDFLAFHTQTISRCFGNFRTHRVRVCPISEEYSGTLSAREKHQFMLRFLFPRLLRHDRTRRSRCPSSITPSSDADSVSSRTDRWVTLQPILQMYTVHGVGSREDVYSRPISWAFSCQFLLVYYRSRSKAKGIR